MPVSVGSGDVKRSVDSVSQPIVDPTAPDTSNYHISPIFNAAGVELCRSRGHDCGKVVFADGRPSKSHRKDFRNAQDEGALAGLRRCVTAVGQCPILLIHGHALYLMLSKFVSERPDVQRKALDALGRKTDNPDSLGPQHDELQSVRLRLATLWKASSIRSISENDCSTSVRGHLIQAWATMAEDPGSDAARWLIEGAPGGVTCFPNVDSISPVVQNQDAASFPPELLETDFDQFHNYNGLEEDDEAFAQIERFADKDHQYLLKFGTLQECREYLGADPVLSRFGVIERVRAGKLKRRVILDLKQSMVTHATRKTHRVVLPRLLDVATEGLELYEDLHSSWLSDPAEHVDSSEVVEQVVLDFVDAYWQIPLARCERRYFVGKLRGFFYVFLRSAQGSRNGGLAWAGVISIVLRMTQAMFWLRGTKPVRLNTYIDDPLISLRGDKATRDLHIAMIVILWRALGFPLSFDKAKRGVKVPWIGGNCEVTPHEVTLSIDSERVQELLDLTESYMRLNVISLKQLRSYAGKVSSFASVVYYLRPFLSCIWAVLCSDGSSNAPSNCAWVKQFLHALKWIRAFLCQTHGPLVRTISRDVRASLC